MSKDKLTRIVQKKLEENFSLPQVTKLVDAVFKSITEVVSEDKELFIKNFGKFKVKVKPAHNARNPRTGEPVRVEEYKRVTFVYGKRFKDLINPKVVVATKKKATAPKKKK